MAWIIDPFIKGDSQKESLHNQLILSIFANAQREPPDLPGVASWVAANDKPTTQSKPVTGDAAEQRLKLEIMQLPPRERHRLKALQEVLFVKFRCWITILTYHRIQRMDSLSKCNKISLHYK